MIEPITAFFLLEGLLFDIIGAVIIVRGLYPINPYQLKKVKEIEEDFIKEQYRLHDLIKNKKEIIQQEHFEVLGDISSSILLQQTKMDTLGKMIPTQIKSIENYEQHKYSLSKAIRGLPFLVGGFLLQGIGVITQLY